MNELATNHLTPATNTQAVHRAREAYRYIFGQQPGELSLQDMRSRLEKVMEREAPSSGFDVEQLDVNGVSALKVTPEDSKNGVRRSVLVWYHGGGYVMGSAKGTLGLAAALANELDCDVVVPDYRLAPESPFPAAVDDAKSVADWAIQTYGATSTLLGGESAGGGLVVATLLSLRDEGAQLPCAAILASPLLDLTATAPSLETNSATEVAIFKQSLKALSKTYLRGHNPEDPLASPVFANLGDLPPILVQVADDETLLDDSKKLVTKVREAGGIAEVSVYSNVCHAWHLFTQSMPQAKQAIEAIGEFTRSI